MVKLMLCISCFLILITFTTTPSNEPHGYSIHMLRQAFDRYGNICWANEKVRLDNFAIQLQDWPDWHGYIIVHAGRRACRGEAQTRAERAKKWLVEKRGIEASRILLKEGGYREGVTTELWMWPANAGEFPIDPSLKPNEVKLMEGCKVYKPTKCRDL